MKAYLIIDHKPPQVLYHLDKWPADLYRLRSATNDDANLPIAESLFKTKNGNPHPCLDGFFDPDFLEFGLYRQLANEKKGA